MITKLILLKCVVLYIVPCVTRRHVINVVYYELPPFIEKVNNSVQGIVPNITDKISNLCNVTFNYSLDVNTDKNLFRHIKTESKKNQNSTGDWLWLPLTRHISQEILKSSGLERSPIFYSGIDVLVHRDQLGIFAKIKVGMFECRYLFLIGLLTSIIFGVSIWFIERWNNADFERHCNGIFTGLWLAWVTMTTVGYGDITPRSSLGKILAMGWMIIGVILTAILTSTITNVFEDHDYLNMHNRPLTAVKDSAEAWIAKHDYQAEVLTVADYEKLFDSLERKKYKVGLADSFVRVHNKEKYAHLRTIKRILSDVTLTVLHPNIADNPTFSYLRECYFDAIEMDDTALHRYQKRLEDEKLSLELDSVEVFTDPALISMIVLASTFLLLGLFFQVTCYLRRVFHKNPLSGNGVDGSLESDLNHNAKHFATKDDIYELHRNITSIREDISLIRAAVIHWET